MLPNIETALTVEGSLGGQTTAMSIDLSSLPHLMSVLTDLYSDPEMAVIREYSTNALDAHIEAGIDKPIEVTLPSTLSPYFKVKDYGVGLSVTEINEIYSKYGASTKRDTNDQIGMLGLGCKSALTYTQNFTLVSRKNGIKISANISRVEDGTGAIEIIDTCATDEPSGVEIVVPTKRYNEFGRKSLKFFQYWEEGKVLVDGKSPVSREGWHEVDKNIYMVSDRSKDYIVMGNVAYPTAHRIGSYASYGIVAFVPIGSVDFTPSREALHYTKRTEATIADIKNRFDSALKTSMQKEISAAPNHGEAMKIFSRFYSEFRYGATSSLVKDLMYKGLTFPESWIAPHVNYAPSRYRNAARRETRIYFQNVIESDILLIKGFDVDITATHKKKIKKYAEDNGISLKRAYLFPTQFGSPWTDGLEWVDFETIKAIKLNTPKQRVYKEPGIDVWDPKGLFWKVEDSIPANEEIIFWSSAERNVNYRLLTTVFPSAKMVMLPRNRWDKFMREHPNAKHVRNAIQPKRDIALSILTKEDIEYLSQTANGKMQWMKLDPAKIEDPELVRILNIVQKGGDSKTIAEFNAIANSVESLGFGPINLNLGPRYQFSQKYPLLGGYSIGTSPHTYIYINAVYQANKEAK